MSELTDAIANARRQIARDESPIRKRLRRAYKDATDALTDDLERVTRMIADARATGETVNPDWLRRQSRYRQLLQQAQDQYKRFADTGVRIIRDGQAAAVSGGAHAAQDMLAATGFTSFDARINTQAVERVLSAMQEGSPLRDVLDAYGEHAATVIEDELTAGIIEGKGLRDVTRTIRRGIKSGTNRARLDALVRTESMRAFRGSLGEQMASYEEQGVGYRWVAAKDQRTCLSCLYRDGQVTKEPPDQQHPNCRCIFHIVPIGGGPAYESGVDWFARQPEDVQRRMMPSGEAFEAFKDGTLTLKDFSGVKRSQVWGTSFVERSGREALQKAGAA